MVSGWPSNTAMLQNHCCQNVSQLSSFNESLIILALLTRSRTAFQRSASCLLPAPLLLINSFTFPNRSACSLFLHHDACFSSFSFLPLSSSGSQRKCPCLRTDTDHFTGSHAHRHSCIPLLYLFWSMCSSPNYIFIDFCMLLVLPPSSKNIQKIENLFLSLSAISPESRRMPGLINTY